LFIGVLTNNILDIISAISSFTGLDFKSLIDLVFTLGNNLVQGNSLYSTALLLIFFLFRNCINNKITRYFRLAPSCAVLPARISQAAKLYFDVNVLVDPILKYYPTFKNNIKMNGVIFGLRQLIEKINTDLFIKNKVSYSNLSLILLS